MGNLKDCKKCLTFKVERVKIRRAKPEKNKELLEPEIMWDVGIKRRFWRTYWVFGCYAKPMSLTHLLNDMFDTIMAFNHPRKMS